MADKLELFTKSWLENKKNNNDSIYNFQITEWFCAESNRNRYYQVHE